MHGQVDGATPAHASMPVHEFRAIHRKHAARHTPLGPVRSILLGTDQPQHTLQRDDPNTIRELAKFV
jgi:hypothetical protein